MEIKISVVLYLLFVPIAFFFGPVDWQVANSITLAAYWSAIVISIVLAWVMFSCSYQAQVDNARSLEVRSFPEVGWVWFTLAAAFVYLKSLQMTGLSLFEGVMVAYKPAKESYAAMVQYSLNRNSNPLLSIGVAAMSFAFWAGLFFLLKNKNVAFRKTKLTFLFLLYSLFVMMKGADKEIMEIVLFLLLFYFFDGQFSGWGKKIAAVSFVLVFVVLVAVRKLNRSAEDICFYLYCLDEDASVLEEAFALLIGYSVQGLKGLSVALEGQFFSRPEFCVSPMVSSFIGRMTEGCRGYGAAIELINSSGVWTSKGQWVSLPVWLSSLGGLWVVPLVLFVHAFIFSYALESKARLKENFFFFIFVFYSLIYFIYLPANNQVFLTADSMLLFVFSLVYVSVKFVRSFKWAG